jgi:G3E family GTPase
MADSTPITILAGLRGTGKSTILNHLLRQGSHAGTAVLVNERGPVEIDHPSVQRFDTSAGFLQAGCPCCAGQNGLARALRGLLARARRGDITRVVVEATGLLDPMPILACLGTDPAIAAAFHLEAFITVVDPLTGMSPRMPHPWAVRQIAIADRIVVNKTDQGNVAALRNRLIGWNTAQPIVESVDGRVHADEIFVRCPPDISRLVASDSIEPMAGEIIELAAPSSDGEDISSARIRTFYWTIRHSIDWPGFAAKLNSLLAIHGDHILRVRGIVRSGDTSGSIMLHAVGHRLHPPKSLKNHIVYSIKNSGVVIVTNDMPGPNVANLKQALYAAGSDSCIATLPSR